MHVLFALAAVIACFSFWGLEKIAPKWKLTLCFLACALSLGADLYSRKPAEAVGGHIINTHVEGPVFDPEGRIIISLRYKNNGSKTIYSITRRSSANFSLISSECDVSCMFGTLSTIGVIATDQSLEPAEELEFPVGSLINWQERMPLVESGKAKIHFLSEQYYRDDNTPPGMVYRRRYCFELAGANALTRCNDKDSNTNATVPIKDLKFSSSRTPARSILLKKK